MVKFTKRRCVLFTNYQTQIVKKYDISLQTQMCKCTCTFVIKSGWNEIVLFIFMDTYTANIGMERP